jgi:hypothetical protein
MTRAAFPVPSTLAVLAGLAIGCGGSVDVDARAQDIQTQYGVTIVYEVGPDFLPAAWLESPTDGEAQPIGEAELARVLRLLPGWMDKYPTAVIQANLERVLICGRLLFYGTGAGGTTYENDLYIANRGPTHGYSDRVLELTFHHEFSSILFRNYMFPVWDWAAANPPGFEYLTEWDDVLEAIERAETEGNEALYREGLLAEYGRTELENDFNMYAELALTDPARMKALIDGYPVVRAKYEVLKAFYLAIDPTFEGWFIRIG